MYDAVWLATAQRNTAAFERVFPNIPSNNNPVCHHMPSHDAPLTPRQDLPASSGVLTLSSPGMSDAEKREELSHVRGHLCLYALEYLTSSGFDFSLLKWGASIVVQETVFH